MAIDFAKRSKSGRKNQPVNPIDIYGALDRKSDKGPLRPVQEEILKHWHEKKETIRTQ